MKSSKNKEKDNLMDWEIYDDKTKKKSKNNSNKINETNKVSILDQFLVIDELESQNDDKKKLVNLKMIKLVFLSIFNGRWLGIKWRILYK